METATSNPQAEALFDQGMEHWWVGDRRTACRYFRRALKLDSQHSCAHNHLGIDCMDRGRLKDAERHYKAAIEGATRFIVPECGELSWGHLENRYYLRPLANLGRLYLRRKRYGEAARLFERCLFLNPGDNMGLRWLLGGIYHRMGDLDLAIEAYRKGLEEPGVCFGLALAFHEAGDERELGVALLRAFCANRYIAPMLLGQQPERVEGFHGSNMADLQWATDTAEEQGDLWRKSPRALETLERWWEAEPVKAWRARLNEITRALGHLEPGPERSLVVHKSFNLADETTLRALADQVAPVEPPKIWKRPYIATPEQVHIAREGEYALIKYADDEARNVSLRLGPELEGMSDAEVLERLNDVLFAQQVLRAQHPTLEIPHGRPQLRFDLEEARWCPRGDVLRCLITEGQSAQDVIIRIDEQQLTPEDLGRLLSVYTGWGMRLVLVPQDEIHTQPDIELGEREH